jgi:hypothetical protein
MKPKFVATLMLLSALAGAGAMRLLRPPVASAAGASTLSTVTVGKTPQTVSGAISAISCLPEGSALRMVCVVATTQ